MKYGDCYYEIETGNGETVEFEELENAIEYADANGVEVIYEIGGSYDEYKKCAFCGEWFTCYELNEYGDCSRCEQAIKDHGGY